MSEPMSRSRPFRLFYADPATGESWALAFGREDRRDTMAAEARGLGFVVLAWDVQRLPLEAVEVQPSRR